MAILANISIAIVTGHLYLMSIWHVAVQARCIDVRWRLTGRHGNNNMLILRSICLLTFSAKCIVEDVRSLCFAIYETFDGNLYIHAPNMLCACGTLVVFLPRF